MKAESLAICGIYSAKNLLDQDGKNGLYLILGLAKGEDEKISKIFNAVRMGKKRYTKYDIPILVNGTLNYIHTDAIYPVLDEPSTRFIGALGNNEFCNMFEFIEMVFQNFAYRIGMSKADPMPMLEEYLEANDFAEIEEQSSRLKTEPYKTQMALAIERAMGPSELIEHSATTAKHSSLVDDQKEFAKRASESEKLETPEVVVVDSPVDVSKPWNPYALAVKETPQPRKKRKYHRKPKEPHPHDELTDFMRDFKTKFYPKAPKDIYHDINTLEEFIPIYELARDEKRCSEFARILGIDVKQLYNIASKYRLNKL